MAPVPGPPHKVGSSSWAEAQEMGNMKKTYSKPVLVKKGKLSQIAANGASNPR